MVVFNECRIDKEGKNLIIDVSVDSLPFYKDVYLESITIDSDKTFIEHGPSSTPIYSKNFADPDDVEQGYNGIIDSGVFVMDSDEETRFKNVRLQISYKDLGLDNLNDNILFVYIGVEGTPEPDTPCGMDNKYSMAVAVNLRPIYNMAMGYIKELEGTCTPPRRLIDMILRLNAFELSVKTGNFLTAIKQWDKLFKNKRIVSPNKCGCNGIL